MLFWFLVIDRDDLVELVGVHEMVLGFEVRILKDVS